MGVICSHTLSRNEVWLLLLPELPVICPDSQGCELGRSRWSSDLSLGLLLGSPAPCAQPCSPLSQSVTFFLPQACAPLYSWRTEKDIPHSDATGTCYLSARNFTKFVEYAPCRTGNLSFTLLKCIFLILSRKITDQLRDF